MLVVHNIMCINWSPIRINHWFSIFVCSSFSSSHSMYLRLLLSLLLFFICNSSVHYSYTIIQKLICRLCFLGFFAFRRTVRCRFFFRLLNYRDFEVLFERIINMFVNLLLTVFFFKCPVITAFVLIMLFFFSRSLSLSFRLLFSFFRCVST